MMGKDVNVIKGEDFRDFEETEIAIWVDAFRTLDNYLNEIDKKYEYDYPKAYYVMKELDRVTKARDAMRMMLDWFDIFNS